MLAEKTRTPLYFAEIRLCVFGEDPEDAVKSFTSFFELFRTTDQGFKLMMVKSLTERGAIKKKIAILEEMLTRKIEIPKFGRKNVFSATELALLAHIPGEEVTGDVEWTYERKDMTPPVNGWMLAGSNHTAQNLREVSGSEAEKVAGEDLEDAESFVFPEVTPFVTKELLYTALTRAKSQLHIIVHEDLKQELPLILSKVYDNSAIEQRKTLLFEYKISPLRAYSLRLRDGRIIELKSKIEYIIANILDKSGIEFEYEPEDFWLEYRIKPDFKLSIDGESYYWEHLGLIEYRIYRNRWFYKKQIYEKLGIIDKLITTTEGERTSIEESIENIINDLKSKNLKTTENSYSKHHYEI